MVSMPKILRATDPKNGVRGERLVAGCKRRARDVASMQDRVRGRVRSGVARPFCQVKLVLRASMLQ
jgi:hypothetical protein